jgi:hypothetical protein
MTAAKKFLIALCLTLIVAGLSLLACDAIYVANYGVGFNEGAFFLDNGEFVDWPTSERPLYAYFPLGAYGIAACFSAIILFSLSPSFGPHLGRTLRGTE